MKPPVRYRLRIAADVRLQAEAIDSPCLPNPPNVVRRLKKGAQRVLDLLVATKNAATRRRHGLPRQGPVPHAEELAAGNCSRGRIRGSRAFTRCAGSSFCGSRTRIRSACARFPWKLARNR
jgi:hypothetical protein